jgi:hypothetical protein
MSRLLCPDAFEVLTTHSGVPFMGHVVPYIRDAYRTLTQARLYFGDDRKPFSMTLAGEVMYVITSPQDVIQA